MKNKTVILVHGIWMTGFEMSWLGQQLKNSGYEVHYFRYSSLFVEPQKSAKRLQIFIRDLNVEQIDLIGHSLGGIILLHLFSLEAAEISLARGSCKTTVRSGEPR